ncbi:hypothetical protein [Lolliginicoccus levis]|uniref:hypothetical protein n=1 Tax=Lolliginicoccus levis TaxID=2919542 RepID=UPI00241E89BF|nr:hypothetical protein [Lolliginicoccus levis]
MSSQTIAPLSPAKRVARMSLFEVRYTFKQRMVLAMLAFGPVMAILLATVVESDDRAVWGTMVASTTPVLVTMSVASALAIVIAVRRESHVFKALRTTELSPVQMVLALAAPYLVIGMVVGALVLGAFTLLGAPAPESWALLLAGLVGVVMLSIIGGIATGAFSTSAASVQFTTIPVLLVSVAFPTLALQPLIEAEARSWLLLAPFSGVADLLARGMGADLASAPAALGMPIVLVDVLSTVVWIGAGLWLARATWRWEPRA